MEDRALETGNKGERPQFPPLANLDEIESKPFNSMHFDELLKNVMSVEESQLLQNPSSSTLPTSFFLGNFNLNEALSTKKTADEVWNEHVNAVANDSLQHRLSSINGETTAPEHFLVHAGVINLGNQNSTMNAQQLMAIDPSVMVGQQENWFQFQVAGVQQQMTMLDSNYKVCTESVYENSNSGVNLDYSENQVGISMPTPMPEISASSSESQATADRKRHFSDEMKEKSIERRQKRMIKNRESAARSRARKQAYTNQLEHEVFQLRKRNSWLKKQKEVDIILSSNPTPMPKYQLRRTSSAPF